VNKTILKNALCNGDIDCCALFYTKVAKAIPVATSQSGRNVCVVYVGRPNRKPAPTCDNIGRCCAKFELNKYKDISNGWNGCSR
jgi:hypothetical protein